jgi:tRNA-2-methylthio-N6-dimethylallyladenosine synthase
MSPHPALFDERLMTVIRNCRTVCEGIHLPAQSGCDRLLGMMRRGYTAEDFSRTAARLRDAVPGVVLSTDIIVGFPSETETEFSQTLAWITALRPSTAFCFKYSAREGTAAASLPDDVPAPVKEERLAALNSLVDRLTEEALQARVGEDVEVLAETPGFGRTRGGFKVRWQGSAAPGSMAMIRIGSATRRTLLGDIHEPHNP